MIRARSEFTRRSHKRGPAAAGAGLLVLLVLLVGVHPISDNVVEHADLVCAAAVLGLGVVVALGGRERSPAPRPPARVARPVRAARFGRLALVANDARSLPLLR